MSLYDTLLKDGRNGMYNLMIYQINGILRWKFYLSYEQNFLTLVRIGHLKN